MATHVELANIENAFTFHPVRLGQPERYEAIRGSARELATYITTNVPAGPERSLAITKLREAVMWANAGIACGEARGMTASGSRDDEADVRERFEMQMDTGANEHLTTQPHPNAR